MSTLIEVSHLQKYYGKHLGVSDVSFKVQAGEVFGFLGSNGAGKSTTIRCLLGLIKPSGGQISLFGDRYSSLPKALNHIGYMPSEAQFYPSMKAKDVIALAAKAHKQDCSKEEERLCEILEVPLQKKISDLSLGNRKKVSIVCALQHQPQLLILDEPTSGLDPLMQERFFDLIKETCANGAACLLSSHVLSDIKNNCQRAAIIKSGRLLTVDSIENLTRSQAKRVTVWKQGQESHFNFSGTGAELLAELGKQAPDDFLVEEPSLEDLFLHYYEEDKDDITKA
ncbi:ABC transporter ATP-binding protein [Streptococcus sobrinus]|uniref:ABC transporter ATP-binding protein n=1 Tax=Streptococcus sobrinus TaxID=1310 RepID=UPI0002F59A4A|nr:ABC transporter ATP-binding protein [Streptococcus sobrinus]AWN18842.1 ABC transporter ATP-binding protein [Streptococcus sobrinus]